MLSPNPSSRRTGISAISRRSPQMLATTRPFGAGAHCRTVAATSPTTAARCGTPIGESPASLLRLT